MARPRKVPVTENLSFPRQIVLEGSKVTADLIQIDGKEYVSITTLDGASTDYPVSSLESVRPNIFKAVFNA